MPRVTRIEWRAVHGTALHEQLAVSSTSSATLLFRLPVMDVAECARVADDIELSRIADIRPCLDVIAHETSRRTAARYDAAPTIAFVSGALEQAPMRGDVVAVTSHRALAIHD